MNAKLRSSMHSFPFLMPLVALAACSSSSSSNPSAQSYANELVATYCQALNNCCSVDSGGPSYCPVASPTACEQAFATTVSGTEACSQSQTNQCLMDVMNQSCTSLNPRSLVMPGSCTGC